MKQRYFPILIGAGLLISGSIITGLANADMGDLSHKRGKFMAKKLGQPDPESNFVSDENNGVAQQTQR